MKINSAFGDNNEIKTVSLKKNLYFQVWLPHLETKSLFAQGSYFSHGLDPC